MCSDAPGTSVEVELEANGLAKCSTCGRVVFDPDDVVVTYSAFEKKVITLLEKILSEVQHSNL